jgi:hypothetical protein
MFFKTLKTGKTSQFDHTNSLHQLALNLIFVELPPTVIRQVYISQAFHNQIKMILERNYMEIKSWKPRERRLRFWSGAGAKPLEQNFW